MAPLVTIALPVYNCGHYLEATLDCILAQTFEDYEVVAVLDGCTDNSEEILRDRADGRFQVIKFEQNQGHVAALNRIQSEARGKYLARFDADDLYEPERLRKQVEFLEAHPDVTVLGSRFDYVNDDGDFVSEPKPFPLDHERINRDFHRYTAIGGPTCMYRLDRILEAGGYSEELNHVEDLALWLACLAAGYRFANLPDVLVHYRVHDAQASQRNFERQQPQLEKAYAKHGPQIWGKRYRPWGSKEPKLQKIRRKVADLGTR